VAQEATRFARLERYLSGLPGGYDSYPECVAKGALVRNLLEREVVSQLLPALPEPLRRLAAEPPMGSEWIPEVHFDALLLAVADAGGRDDADLLVWTRNRNRTLFRSPAYRILMAVASPAQLLRFAGARWGNWHRGTTLEVEGIGDDGVVCALRHPPGLFDRNLVRVYGEAFIAALELANARAPKVEVLSEEPRVARYRASWG
jgi:hypothetical protein